MTLSPATDPRILKAFRIAHGAQSWIKCRDKQGRPLAFGIPSSTGNGRYYLANTRRCTCPDFERRQEPCKHVMAVIIHCERCKAEKAASVEEAA